LTLFLIRNYFVRNFAKKLIMAKEVVISNSKLNDRGSRIITAGIDISQYQRNPILLWMHNRVWRGTTDEVLPIGRMENLRFDGDNLIGTPVFDANDEFAKKIQSKWDAGILQMVSVGIDVIETSNDVRYLLPGQTRESITKSKLMEVSIVDIGSNDDAIALYNEGKTLKLAAGEDSSILPLLKKETDNHLNNTNQMKSIALKLGLPETATETEILEKIGRLQLQAQNADSLQQKIDEQMTKAIEGVVDTAIAAKKITADKKQHFVTLGKTSGLEVLNATLEMVTASVKPADVINAGTTKTETKKFSELSADERIELRKSDVEKYKALFKAEYGFIPEV